MKIPYDNAFRDEREWWGDPLEDSWQRQGLLLLPSRAGVFHCSQGFLIGFKIMIVVLNELKFPEVIQGVHKKVEGDFLF
jgi:hypothetical protein